jgi:hypothetical protein
MLSSWRMYEMHPALFLKAGCYSDASAGLVVPSCGLAVAWVHGQVLNFQAGLLTLSTVWP